MKNRTHWLKACALALCVGSMGGCADEIDVHPPPPEQRPSSLVGSWEWKVGVSFLDVDDELNATQVSDFDSPGASPSSYVMRPEGDGVLALEGWHANAPCEPTFACDEGRVFQRHHMSYHVDDEHFFPFALQRLSGSPGVIGGAGAGVFEGFGVEETRLADPLPSGDPAYRVVETRWRLTLAGDGTFSSRSLRTELIDPGTVDPGTVDPDDVEDTHETGTWVLAEDGGLTLHDSDGDTKATRWLGDVIALDGLIFTRLD